MSRVRLALYLTAVALLIYGALLLGLLVGLAEGRRTTLIIESSHLYQLSRGAAHAVIG